jgi:hypothetical protein
MPYDRGVPACTRRQNLLRAMQIEAAFLATEERNLMYLGVGTYCPADVAAGTFRHRRLIEPASDAGHQQ